MIIDEKSIIKEIQTVFESDNESLVHDTISYIHENGTCEMIPLLFDLLGRTSSITIQNDIFDCLTDTKDQNAIPLLIDALRDTRFTTMKNRLISVLWQTNLNFSEHIDVLIDSLLHDNYETAIEAFTAIEVCTPHLSEEKRNLLKQQLRNAVIAEKSEKVALLSETIHILE